MHILFYPNVSEAILRFLPSLVLFIIGIVSELRFVGRFSLFSNAAALFLFFYPMEVPNWLGILLDVIIVVGLFAGIARVLRLRLPGWFYQVGWIGSSVVTGVLLLIGLTL